MIALQQFDDYGWMDSLVKSTGIYPEISDDQCPDITAFSVHAFDDVGHVFLLVNKDGQRAGFFVFLDRGNGVWEQHTVLGEGCRGKSAIEAGNRALAWMTQNCGAKQFSSFCYSDKPHTCWYAKKLGYTAGDTIAKTTRNGVPVDVISFVYSPQEI